jgi:hypothetical protein
MIFVSGYTKDTPYEVEVQNLRKSLECFGLRYDLVPYEHRGSWLANCHYIPIACRDMLKKYPGENIIWLDADAVVQRYPSLLFELEREGKADFAVHMLPREDGWMQLADGTMFIRNNPRGMKLMEDWITNDEKMFPFGTWEQKVLEDMLPHEKNLVWQDLPAEYCFIFDNETQMKMIKEEPIIVHYQTSRRFRKILPKILATEEFLKKLPRPVAVVGNGAGFKPGDGLKVDSYPSVLRMNNFVLEGYEDLVGRKTTAWVVSCCWNVPYRELGVPVLTPFGGEDYVSLDPWVKEKRCPHLMIPNENWGKRFDGGPSTGLTLLYILEVLGVETYAYGFDSFRTGHYWEPGHRYDYHSDGELEIVANFKHVKVMS